MSRKPKRRPQDTKSKRRTTGRASRNSRTDTRLQAMFTIGLWVIPCVVFLVFVFVVWHIVIRFEHESSRARQGMVLLASYPRFLTTEDQGGILITVVNTRQDPVRDTTVCLDYRNAKHVSMDIDGTNLVRFGTLEPSERKTKLVRFQVNRVDLGSKELQVDLNLSAESDVAVANTNTLTHTLRITPTVNSWLLPMDVCTLMLSRRVTVPNLVIALGSVLTSVKLVVDIVKRGREFHKSELEKDSSS